MAMEKATEGAVPLARYLCALGWVRELLALVDEYARESGGCDDGSERGGDDRPSMRWLREHDEARVELEMAALAARAGELRTMVSAVSGAQLKSQPSDDDFEVAPV